MIEKTYLIDYYAVDLDAGNLDNFLNRESEQNFLHQKMQIGDYDVILDHFEETPAFICGNITRVQMRNIQPKYNTQTFETSALDLSNNEGLPAASAFLYLKTKKILLYQAGRTGVGTNLFCNYLERYTHCGHIDLSFLVNPESFSQLSELEYISKIEVMIKNLDSNVQTNQKNADPMVKKSIKTFQDLKTNVLHLTLSKGKRAMGLDKQGSKNWVSGLYRMLMASYGEDMDSKMGTITITGREDDESPMKVVDLILQRYRAEIKFTVHQDNRLNADIYTAQRLRELKNLAREAGRIQFIKE